jgi:UDP-4-amino-4,6-dideoxy-N-acetyl-beta-L-altrosamine transaminase
LISGKESEESKKNTYLPYARQWIDEEDIQAVVDVLRSDWITTGPKIEEFEKKFAKYIGVKHAVAVSSGTAGLHAAVFAAGIGDGDEVITTPYTFVATANCILYQGARLVFADIDPTTLNIDPKEISKRITSKTKAIICVDFAGQPCDYGEILGIAKEHDLIVISDAAHSLGAEYEGQKVGTISDMTAFSFHAVKTITTGEGGMITTNNDQYAGRLRNFRSHGITTDARQREKAGIWSYEMVDLGYNYRITDFQCALGIKQLDKLGAFIDKRDKLATRYGELLSSTDTIDTPVIKEDVKHAWHIYVIKLNQERLKIDRLKLFKEMRNKNIGVNVHYIPVHMHPYYKKRFGFSEGDYPIAEDTYRNVLTLPLFPKMTILDQDRVVQALKVSIETIS